MAKTTKESVIASLKKIGITVKDGKVSRNAVRKALSELDAKKGTADIEPEHFKAQFLEAVKMAFESLGELNKAIGGAALISENHDPSGIEKKNVAEIQKKLKEVEALLKDTKAACESDRKK